MSDPITFEEFAAPLDAAIAAEQRSAEWLAARVGKATASRISDVIARTKVGWGATRANYMAELVAERLTGVPTEHYVSDAMQWGTDTEAEARAAYSFRTDLEVVECGFAPHPTIAMTGASPDGLIEDYGLLQIKCPYTATHIDTLINGRVPDKYLVQMLWEMACTGRQWCDFVSYDPRLPESMRLFVHRVLRDDTRIASIEIMVKDFLDEVERKVTHLRKLYEPARAA